MAKGGGGVQDRWHSFWHVRETLKMVFDQVIINKKITKYFVTVTSLTHIISIKGSCSEYNVRVLFLLVYNQRLRCISFCAFLGGGGV